MTDNDAERIVRYVLFNCGDGCGMCVGETIYKFYCEYYNEIKLTLDDLYDIADESRSKINPENTEFCIRYNADNSGKIVAKYFYEEKEKIGVK